MILRQMKFIRTDIPMKKNHSILCKYPLSICLIILGFSGFGQTSDDSYTKVYSSKKEGLSDLTMVGDNESVSETIEYYDGLGRPIQVVNKQVTPSGFDIITPMVYDEFGRQSITYLSYPTNTTDGLIHSDPISEQQSYYEVYGEGFGATAFAQSEFEKSSLGRLLEVGAPGPDWQIGLGHTSLFRYQSNTDEDGVIIWKVIDNSLSRASNYIPASLSKQVAIDEQGNSSYTYTDQEGRVVLKRLALVSEPTISSVDGEYPLNPEQWADTYYVYDDYGSLRFVLQPEGVKRLLLGTITKADLLDNYAFQYQYDGRNRMISKKVPGAKLPVHMVYDQLNRLVLTQDGNQRGDNKWLYVAYDKLNRPVITGDLVDSRDRQGLQDHINLLGNDINSMSLSYVGGGEYHGYDDAAYPLSNRGEGSLGAIFTVNYYDNYDFIADLSSLITDSFDEVYDLPFEISTVDDFHLEPIQQDNVKGQLTGSKVALLDGSAFLETITFYDNKYRVIQVISSNHLGGVDVVSNQFDFVGNLRAGVLKHTGGDIPLTIVKEYGYDPAFRLTEVTHSINGADPIVLLTNTYNEMGELIEKNLHSESEGVFAQSVDYQYNIRGWLRAINESGFDGSIEAPEPSDLFSLELIYNSPLPENSGE